MRKAQLARVSFPWIRAHELYAFFLLWLIARPMSRQSIVNAVHPFEYYMAFFQPLFWKSIIGMPKTNPTYVNRSVKIRRNALDCTLSILWNLFFMHDSHMKRWTMAMLHSKQLTFYFIVIFNVSSVHWLDVTHHSPSESLRNERTLLNIESPAALW